jgi:sulfate permease, SulP family
VASVILTVVGFMESLTLGKIMADKFNYRISVKREVIALGCTNVMGSMFSSYYTGGAFSRTALNSVLGPKSNIHGLVQGASHAACCTPFLLGYVHRANLSVAPLIVFGIMALMDLCRHGSVC